MLVAPTSTRELNSLPSRDHSLLGGMVFGIDGHVIELQARAMEVQRKPVPWRYSTSITGMATGATRESLARIAGAFSKYNIPDPQVDILVNLAPADLEKGGAWLDLPIAIIILQAAGMLPDLPEDNESNYILMGELGLHGEMRRVPGALSIAYNANPGQKLIVPKGNEKECALILAKPGHEGCGVFPAPDLKTVIRFFAGKTTIPNALQEPIKFENAIPKSVDFGKIKGQKLAKRAATISAAGGHNLLLFGPPGEGKSMIAKAMPGILPRLSDHEKVELTRIYSACGELSNDGMAVTRRPMRAAHHSASKASIIGGGSGVPKPGEITLAHLGVLFLDEIAEFPKSTLDSLRQPIEDGEISITRVNASLKFPTQFTLVAAMNPCPCGYFGSPKCKCTDRVVKSYQKKISGPLLDRIDLQIEIKPLTLEEKFSASAETESPRLRAQVESAREIQRKRFAGQGIFCNATIPGGAVSEYVDFSTYGLDLFKGIAEDGELSTRSVDRLAKVARTIADLAQSPKTEGDHVEEAAKYVVGGLLRDSV